MRFVIIGNGVAGITAAQILAKKAPSGSTITQFTAEEYTYYPRPKLYDFLRQDLSPNDVIVRDLSWYEDLNIELHVQEKVESINPEEKNIITSQGSYAYDKLLLATGAECFCPVIPGTELKHFYTMRSLKDAINIRAKFKEANSVVIIGGGILGIEVACACIERGLDTSIIEFFPSLLPRQLDTEGGQVLQHMIEEQRKIRFFLDTKVEKILGEEHVEAVLLYDGTEIHADLVIACTGIAPRVQIAKEAGIEINRAIIVNDYLEASVKDVYAAGDIAEHEGRIYGLIPPSMEQARIAAHNMISHRSQKYHGSVISATIKVADLLVTSLGYTGMEEEQHYASKKYYNPNKSEFVKIFTLNDQIKAALILGTKKGIPLFRQVLDKSFLAYQGEIRNLFPDLS
ncbi:MAG: NAD(P)/FAD-dependent oxidoreductase [Candidatus Hodarchaeota archaeon]